MNNETYEALKRIINQRGYHYFDTETGKKDYKQIEDWIDEVAKEYEPIKEDVYSVIANNKLYYKKTDGGAEYLCKKAIQGTEVGDIATAIIRLDGGAELL